MAHFVVDEEEQGLMLIRKLLSYFPQNNMEDPPITECDDPIDRKEEDLNSLIPENPNQPYDVKDIVFKIVDNAEFLEVHAAYARNIVVGFAKMGGIPLNRCQPAKLTAGALDIDASRKPLVS